MKRSSHNINFHFQQSCTLRGRNKLRAFIAAVFAQHKVGLASLNIVFCSDEFLLGINQNYLKHDYYTDIITFDLAEPNAPVEGEIYISIERVKENAAIESVPFIQELHRVIFHGILHLCGFTDKQPAEKKKMTARENALLKKYLVPREIE